jgi:hypothetical protein
MGAMAGLEIRAKNLDEEIAQNPTSTCKMNTTMLLFLRPYLEGDSNCVSKPQKS